MDLLPFCPGLRDKKIKKKKKHVVFEFLFDKTEQKKVFVVAARESKENTHVLPKLPAFPKQDGSLWIQNGVLLPAPNLPCSSQKVTVFYLSQRNKGTDSLLHYLRFHLSVYVTGSSHGFLSGFCSFESAFMGRGEGRMMYLFINDDAEKEDKVVICKSEHLLLMVTVTVVY